MNTAMKLVTKLAVGTRTFKTAISLKVNWLDGSTEYLKGTDIIDAFKKANIAMRRMDDIENWEFVAPPESATEHIAALSDIPEDLIFEVNLENIHISELHLLNGNLPPDVDCLEVGDYLPPTSKQQLENWGWTDDLKAVLITGEFAEDYHCKFLSGLVHLDVPVVFDIKDTITLPKPVRTRMFKVVE